MGSSPPSVAEIRASAMVAYPTTDSSFWSDDTRCVWRRVPVIHRATGAFAILFGRVVHGGAVNLLQAFDPEFMPLPEVFPALTGMMSHMQGADTAIFPAGLTYCDDPRVHLYSEEEKIMVLILETVLYFNNVVD